MRSSRTILLVFLCAMIAGCVEAAPEGASNAGLDGGTTDDAGTPQNDRPTLDFEPHSAQRSWLGNVGLWRFTGDEMTARFQNRADGPSLNFEINKAAEMSVFEGEEGLLSLQNGSHVASADPSALLADAVANETFSLEMWLQFDDPRGRAVVTFPTVGGSALRLYEANGDAVVELGGGMTATTVRARGAFTPRRLVHVVVTYSRNLLSVYVDGVLENAAYASFPAELTDVININIGEGLLGLLPFDGKIQMFAFWSEALSEGEVFQNYLVGPLPDEEDFTDEPSPGLGTLVYGFVPAAPTQSYVFHDRTIEQDVDYPANEDTLYVSSEQQSLLRFISDVSPSDEREVIGDFVGLVHRDTQTDGISFSFAALWKRWDLGSVSWEVWRDGDAWDEPGASGPTDRSEPFATIAPLSVRRYVAQIPPTLFDYWNERPDAHGGLLLFFDGDIQAGTRTFFSEDEAVSSRRPYLVRLVSGGTVPTTALAPPVAIRRENPTGRNDTDLRWAPTLGAEFYDVFANERFIGRTVEPAFIHQNGSNAGTEVRYRVLARDTYGRISAWSQPYVIFAGL